MRSITVTPPSVSRPRPCSTASAGTFTTACRPSSRAATAPTGTIRSGTSISSTTRKQARGLRLRRGPRRARASTSSISRSAPAVLIFSTDEIDLESSARRPRRSSGRRSRTQRRAAFPTPRLRAADAYLVQRGAGRTIIAGYPVVRRLGPRHLHLPARPLPGHRLGRRGARHPDSRGPPTFPRACCPTAFPTRARRRNTTRSTPRSGTSSPSTNTSTRRATRSHADARASLLAAVEAILVGYSKGTRYGIRADSDGLLACGQPGDAT